MADIRLTINGEGVRLNVNGDMPLLWVLRDVRGLTGTKFGCGIGQCGACTVHLNGAAVRSCVTPVSRAAGRQVVTIEGLDPEGQSALTQAWREEDVPQCGYCQSGQLMSAAALLAANPHPNDAEIARAMSGNLCRCGTYPRIRRAIGRAARESAESSRAHQPTATSDTGGLDAAREDSGLPDAGPQNGEP